MNKKSIFFAVSVLVILAAAYAGVSLYRNQSGSSTNTGDFISSPTADSSVSPTPVSDPSPSISSASPTFKVQASPTAQNTKNVQEGIKPGTKAIDFTLTSLDGKKVSLSDFRGKNVYLNFFATWCPPCKRELPDMEKLYREYKDKGLELVVVDLGEKQSTVKSFMESNNYSFSVLLDTDNKVAQTYNISSIPVSYFINKDGIITESKVGALEEDEMRKYIDQLFNS
jgi:peroxiredoxin